MSNYNVTDPKIWPSLKTLASRVDIKELKQPNVLKSIISEENKKGERSQINRTTDSFILYGKEAGVGTSVSDIHKSLANTGVRFAGYDYVAVTGITPNINYSFASQEMRGFDVNKGNTPDIDILSGQPKNAIGMVSTSMPAVGSYFPLPVTILWMNILKEALILEETHRSLDSPDNSFLLTNATLQNRAWRRISAYWLERCDKDEISDLRRIKPPQKSVLEIN